MQSNPPHWRFFRAGGFDQVRLETANELLAIGSLDQKLWVALSCPVKGIEFDAQTLALIDSDADGHVRAPELIAALQWTADRLQRTEVLAQSLAGVPLDALRDDNDVGTALVSTAREVLTDMGISDGIVTVEAASAVQLRWAQRELANWEAAGAQAKPLGEATAPAFDALMAVQGKIDDWFVRCQLTAFDDRAGNALNASDSDLLALSTDTLQSSSAAIAALPLAKVTASGVLSLTGNINPAWQDAMRAFTALALSPLLGNCTSLTTSDWADIKARYQPYATWLASRPQASTQGNAASDLEKLARYVRDLMPLANNFVAFKDFYSRQGRATFQVGTLYLDGRSCELCVAVNDPAKHAAMASLSRICLVYVDCVRGAEHMHVAAAFTAGDSDQLIVGRNGVFYDRQGQDWNATITKIVQHPISLRQAFWAPYKRLATLVSEQLQKLAAGKAKESDDRMALVAQDMSKKASAPGSSKSGNAPPAAKQEAPFDVAKFAGIFAAIGLAVGALGTAAASLLAGLFALAWWQIPIALGGLVLAISGPAVVIAWFKLGSRNLGPLLDANGWAINARARINIPFGTSLTQLAQLPDHSERSLIDPYAEKKKPWGLYAAMVLIVCSAVAAWRSGYFH